MSEVFRATQETAAVAAEMRQSNRDQRDFIRMNEEQMARLATMLGQQRGASPAQLEEAVMRLVAAQREQGVGLGAVILQSASQMSNALQMQAREMSRINPPAREVSEAGTDPIPDLTAGTVPSVSSTGSEESRKKRRAPETSSAAPETSSASSSLEPVKLIGSPALLGSMEENIYRVITPERMGLRELVRTPHSLARAVVHLPTKEMSRKKTQERSATDEEQRRLTRQRQARKFKTVVGGSVSVNVPDDEDI